MKDPGDGVPGQFCSHQDDRYTHKQARDILDPPVTERVVLVGFLSCQPETDQRDHAGRGVREVVEAVGRYGYGPCQQACGEFSRKQYKVKKNTDCSREDAVSAPHFGQVGIFMIRNEQLR